MAYTQSIRKFNACVLRVTIITIFLDTCAILGAVLFIGLPVKAPAMYGLIAAYFLAVVFVYTPCRIVAWYWFNDAACKVRAAHSTCAAHTSAEHIKVGNINNAETAH